MLSALKPVLTIAWPVIAILGLRLFTRLCLRSLFYITGYSILHIALPYFIYYHQIYDIFYLFVCLHEAWIFTSILIEKNQPRDCLKNSYVF